MERRGFFKRTFSAIVTLAAPRWARAQSVDRNAVHELAGVVLPQSLGRARTDKIADAFMQWFGDYKVGAEIGSGYGNPRTQVTGPNPSTHYADQMRALGSPITPESVQKALDDAKVDRIPNRPNGRHIATDLLAYFYGSADGEDFLYNAAIKRDECRGLDTSIKRPPALT